MSRLWLFYPENDIALARNIENFTPPSAALKLRRAGEILPLWMCSGPDRVLCHGINASWLESMKDAFGLEGDVWDHESNLCPTPWGWSKAVRRIFRNEGINPELLPDDCALDNIRLLSHRRTAVNLINKLQKRLSFPIFYPALEVSDISKIRDFINVFQFAVVKSPWSSSGRGILFLSEFHLEQALNQISGTIKKQGSVMVEHFAERMLDFAMLFNKENDTVTFEGYSVFSTDANGEYRGNIVASDQYLELLICESVPKEHIDKIREELLAILSDELKGYSGPIGVDMLLTHNECFGTMVHACVEINLRYTMGFVAKSLARFVSSPAFYYVIPGDHTSECNPVISDKKLTGGQLALNPPGSDFTFILNSEF